MAANAYPHELLGQANRVSTPTYGLELEKVFSGPSGEAHLVTDEYFLAISELNQSRGTAASLKDAGDLLIGVTTPYGNESLDNSFGLGESATGPVNHGDGGLNELDRIVSMQMRDVITALEPSGATVINMANHPLTIVDEETYRKHVAPKPIYEYLRDVRNWDHKSGINAKAQNSPSVGIEAGHAVDALNITLGLGAALVALYANSPFDQGKLAEAKESRLHIWDKVFKNPTYAGDHRLHQMPNKPFDNLREYFRWMFAADTAMYFVVVDEDGQPPKSEKEGHVQFIQIDQQPTLLDFLKQPSWDATTFGEKQKMKIAPHMAHFAMHQFTHFTGARIRFGIREDDFAVSEFNEAMRKNGNEVDELFAEKGDYFYIEGREPGANFPDQQLLGESDEAVARSVIMSPAAIHAGLIRNSAAALQLVEEYGWDQLRGMREAAIKDGMAAVYNEASVSKLCADVLATASDGLDSSEQWMLAYPEHALRTGKSGADRALERFDQLQGPAAARIAQIVREKAIVLPETY